MKKVELLAPAGNYEGFLGAVHAGADAVYLGGMKFGARAYADNFTKEEVCSAIRYAHIYGRKVYLTLNTLVKTKEFDELHDYLLPFYCAGLDGVIIQDMGVFQAVGRWFPGLGRHISTQAAITGVEGIRLLEKLGAERVVPARELSLNEIRAMKAAAGMGEGKRGKKGIEIETFIHGAVCYCYSGRCLFSSMIGGRSGNRGRCAQPCRLPYRIPGGRKESYPLSLKDMCTIGILPELIEAGIDSFKIEGRMKSPEYAAGVTTLYRKYIDRYYRNPDGEYEVEEEDMEKLRALYIRSEISEGYYHRHNGRQMVTLDSPAYAGRDETLEERIRKEYLEGDFRLPVTAKAVLKKGMPALLILRHEIKSGGSGIKNGIEVSVQGETVQPALKQPLSMETVKKQLVKTGNTAFRMERLEIEMEEDGFLPVKALNDLRRMACERLEEAMAREYGTGRRAVPVCGKEASEAEIPEGWKEMPGVEVPEGRKKTPEIEVPKGWTEASEKRKIHVSVLTEEQCLAAAGCLAGRIYLSSNLCGDRAWLSRVKEQCGEETELYLALPHIIRMRDKEFLRDMERLLGEGFFQGVLVRNMEGLDWSLGALRTEGQRDRIVTDAGLYIWNPEAAMFYGEYAMQYYLPYELNAHEIRELTQKARVGEWAAVVYGRIPMMVAANCIVQTGTGCQPCSPSGGTGSRPAFVGMTDRYRKEFPVYTDCGHCYNVIYNSVPLSLRRRMGEMEEMGIHTFRLDFTTETGNDVGRIYRYFTERVPEGERPPYGEYTNGHWKRGVE